MLKNKKTRAISRRTLSVMLCILLCLSGVGIIPNLLLTTVLSAEGDLEILNFKATDSDLTIITMETPDANGNVGLYRAVYCIDRDTPLYPTNYNPAKDYAEATYSANVMTMVENGYSGPIIGGSMFKGTRTLESYGIRNYEEAYIATQLAVWFCTEGSISAADLAMLSDGEDGKGGSLQLYYDLIAEALPQDKRVNPFADITPEVGFQYEYRGGGFFEVSVDQDWELWGAVNDAAGMNTDKILVTVASIGGGTLCATESPADLLGNGTTAVVSMEQVFYVHFDPIPSGPFKIVSGEVSVECSVENKGNFFWFPQGVQPICGWGDYQVKYDFGSKGRNECGAESFAMDIGGTKVIMGSPDSSKTFEFTLNQWDSEFKKFKGFAGTATVTIEPGNSQGIFTFPTIYTPPYTPNDLPRGYLEESFYFTVNETDESASDPGWVYDTDSRKVKVTFTATGPDVKYIENTEQEFINEYISGAEPPGDLIIGKKLGENYEDWGAKNATEFEAQVKILTGEYAVGEYVVFSGDGPVYEYAGTSSNSGDDTIITFSAGQYATIKNLPSGITYQVIEIPGESYYEPTSSPKITIEAGKTVETEDAAEVIIENKYKHGVGNLVIVKVLDGEYEDWGVSASTDFYVQIKDTEDGSILWFKQEPEEDGSYRCIGNSMTGKSEDYDGTPAVKLPVSEAKALTVSNLWDNRKYEVKELESDYSDHYEAAYENNNAVLTLEENNQIVTITNTYTHGTGDLIIKKRLAGNYTEKGVDKNTVFTAKVKDLTNDNYLLFKPEPGGSYRCIGNDADGLSEPYSGEPLTEVPFSVNTSARLTNLWAGDDEHYRYSVEETPGKYATDYEGNDEVFPDGSNHTVTVKNTYTSDITDSKLKISKELNGEFASWGASADTEYQVRVFDATNKNYLLFRDDSDPESDYYEYYCVGNSGSADSSTGTVITVSQSKYAEITNLWPNCIYRAEEVGGEKYTASYLNNSVPLPLGATKIITIINTYEPGGGTTAAPTTAPPDDGTTETTTVPGNTTPAVTPSGGTTVPVTTPSGEGGGAQTTPSGGEPSTNPDSTTEPTQITGVDFIAELPSETLPGSTLPPEVPTNPNSTAAPVTQAEQWDWEDFEDGRVPLASGGYAIHDNQDEHIWYIFDADGLLLGYVVLEDGEDIEYYDIEHNLIPMTSAAVLRDGETVSVVRDDGTVAAVLRDRPAAAVAVTPETAGTAPVNTSPGTGDRNIIIFCGILVLAGTAVIIGMKREKKAGIKR